MLRGPERRALVALAQTLLPMGEPGGPFEKLDVVRAVEDWLALSSPALGLSARLGLAAVELGPLAWGFGPRRFSSLAPERRAAYLRKLEKSRLWTARNLLFSMKVVLMGVVYDRPEIARAVCRSR